jgi:DNA-binding response OmpR family regulator
MSLLVLLVEDNWDLSETVVSFLELEGIVCDYAANAESALRLIRQNAYDVVVLDIGLPRMNGLDLCKQLRGAGHDIPILMLTARDSIEDKLIGFQMGTDDYLVKPFDLNELTARIRVLGKRKSGQSRIIKAYELEMNLDTLEARRGARVLSLTPITWKILEVLVRASPGVVTKEKLIQTVWGDDIPETNSLKVHMHNLRKHVDNPGEQSILQTIPNQGYSIRGIE